MGLFDKLFGEVVDIIEWTDDSPNTMVYRFERYGNEIKYGAKLIVRESQYAVFVNEGQVADVLGPGTWELETKNLPVMTTLQNWQHGFRSPFKAEVYFCSARRFTDLKWGTKQPLMVRDKEFGGLRLRAFGTYTTRIVDPLKFIREIVGTEGIFTTEEISNQLRNLITSRFATIIGNSDIPVLDMAGNQDQLGEFLRQRIAPEFGEYGLELTKLLVENVSLPPKVSEALDARTARGMTGNLDDYLKYQTGVAMEAAATNPGGGGSDAIGMGIGMAMGQPDGQRPRRHGRRRARRQPAPPAAARTRAPRRRHRSSTRRASTSRSTAAPRGPHALEALDAMIDAGRVDKDTLVWSPEMSDWTAAGKAPAVAALFGEDEAAPPPLPPRVTREPAGDGRAA